MINPAENEHAAAIKAVIFDMDGVVTDTAEAHYAAWKDVFDKALDQRQQASSPFTRRDYLDHVDGVPRYDGVRRFLASRGIELPDGRADAEDLESVHGIGNLKNRRFRDWLKANRPTVFEDAVDLIEHLKRAGFAAGVFSASRNARVVLQSGGISGMFDSIVDGEDARDLDLPAKPAPAQLLETARRLGFAPAQAAVFEDAAAGVQAGSAGGFGLVVGVDRQQLDWNTQRHALRAHGADLVTRDLRRLLLPDKSGLRTADRLPSVWDRFDAVRDAIGGRRLSIFLDFDGTLSPIVRDYREARLAPGMKQALEGLAGVCPVAVISGRDLRDMQGRLGLKNVICAGSHGFDIAGPGGLAERPEKAEDFIAPIDEAEAALRDAVSKLDGVEIERKTFSIAVHYRKADEAAAESLDRVVGRVVERTEKLRKSRGEKVLEIQPRTEWDKSSAVDWLLEHTRLGEGDRLPLYIGDDLTDEDAFTVLVGRGLSLVVRGGDDRATLADHALADPEDVRLFLEWLKDYVEKTA